MNELISLLAKHVGSRRYARDLLASSQTFTTPWWPRATMSEDEKEEQRRSFVYGNVALSNPNVTRAMVDQAAERMAVKDQK